MIALYAHVDEWIELEALKMFHFGLAHFICDPSIFTVPYLHSKVTN